MSLLSLRFFSKTMVITQSLPNLNRILNLGLFVFGSHLLLLRAYPWFCAQGRLFREYGIESRWATCKTSECLPTALFLSLLEYSKIFVYEHLTKTHFYIFSQTCVNLLLNYIYNIYVKIIYIRECLFYKSFADVSFYVKVIFYT